MRPTCLAILAAFTLIGANANAHTDKAFHATSWDESVAPTLWGGVSNALNPMRLAFSSAELDGSTAEATHHHDEDAHVHEERQARMHQWRNIHYGDGEPDSEIAAINEMERELGSIPDEAQHIRALISRFDSLSHYRAFDNLLFLIDAIGAQEYPGMPAVDVLARYENIDDDRRERFKNYLRALETWLGHDREADNAGERAEVNDLLGESNPHKRWLVASLAKTLKEYALLPEDVIAEHSDADYVQAVYEAALGRHASEDDLRFRVKELRDGKTREALLNEVLYSIERRDHALHHIADILKHGPHEHYAARFPAYSRGLNWSRRDLYSVDAHGSNGVRLSPAENFNYGF